MRRALLFRRWLGVVGLICFAVALSAISISVRYYRTHAIGDKASIISQKDGGIILLDRNDEPFFTFGPSRVKTYVPIDGIPRHTQLAIIAAEDKEFFKHPGFSFRGFLRAAYLNTRLHVWKFGGSTITQQLIKNTMLTTDKSLLRKYQELILAIKLEHTYSKKDILEMYLNSTYFGEGIYGIEEAAQVYFNKHASELTLAESSMLAGLLPAPSVYSPLSGQPEGSRQRQEYVLREMVQMKAITPLEKTQAEQEKLVLNPQGNNINHRAPHFALMVRDELFKKYGQEKVMQSGFRVVTTLDLKWQNLVEQELANHIEKFKKSGAGNGAVVVLDPTTGEIRALAGSYDWNDPNIGRVNMAIQPRQTGSAFKPVVYATAFERGTITPATILHDIPTVFAGSYRPVNYDGRFHGNVLARFALANSFNVPSVEIASRITPAPIAEMAKRLGITTLSKYAPINLSIALGTEEVSLVELTGVYGTLANSGAYNSPTIIKEIYNKQGQTVAKHASEEQPVLDPAIAFQLSSILSDSNARSYTFGRSLTVPNLNPAVKTGTTQDYRDAWTIGYTPDVVVGVWIGNNNNKPMNRLAGSLGAAPLWQKIIQEFAKPQTSPFNPPPTVIATRVCRSQGLLASANDSSNYTEYFLPGTEPMQFCQPLFKPNENKNENKPEVKVEKDKKKEEDKNKDDKKKPKDKEKETKEAMVVSPVKKQ